MITTSITLKDSLEVVTLPARTTATHALLLLHGRGASALNILRVTEHLSIPNTCLVTAPQAPKNTWYPNRFIEPQEANEPELSKALSALADVCAYLRAEHALQPEQITLAGFSQGACLVAEFIKRSPEQYCAAALLSGGLIGTDQEVVTSGAGSVSTLPIYLGCDEADFHIPKARVVQTAEYFTNHGAEVDLKLYTGLGHTIHPDGLRFIEEHLC